MDKGKGQAQIMNQKPSVTFVSAANQNYFWGLYLLAASMERWELNARLLIFYTGLDAVHEGWLRQFSRVEVRPFRTASAVGLHCRKAAAGTITRARRFAPVARVEKRALRLFPIETHEEGHCNAT